MGIMNEEQCDSQQQQPIENNPDSTPAKENVPVDSTKLHTNPFRQLVPEPSSNSTQAAQKANIIAAIQVKPVKTQTSFGIWAKVKETTVIPANCMREIKVNANFCDELDRNQKSWIVEKTQSSAPGREWMVSNCIVNEEKACLSVPVVNLSGHALRWAKGRSLVKVKVLEETPEPIENTQCHVVQGSSSSLVPHVAQG